MHCWSDHRRRCCSSQRHRRRCRSQHHGGGRLCRRRGRRLRRHHARGGVIVLQNEGCAPAQSQIGSRVCAAVVSQEGRTAHTVTVTCWKVAVRRCATAAALAWMRFTASASRAWAWPLAGGNCCCCCCCCCCGVRWWPTAGAAAVAVVALATPPSCAAGVGGACVAYAAFAAARMGLIGALVAAPAAGRGAALAGTSHFCLRLIYGS